MSQHPAGWYDDPSDPENLRYWDGVTWTAHTAPKKSPTASQSTIGGTAPTTPMPQGSGWQQPPTPGQAGPDAAGPGAAGPGAAGAGQTGPGAAGPGQAPRVPEYPYQQQYPYQQPAPQVQGWAQSVPTTADGAPLASWGRRFGAWLVDGVIIVIVSGFLVGILIPEYTDMINSLVTAVEKNDADAVSTIAANNAGTMLKVSLLSYAIMTVYTIAFWTTTAQTIGKMLFRISVRRVDRPGPLDLTTAVRRRLLQLASVIPGLSNFYAVIALVDGLFPLWDKQRQTLHDKIAATQVVLGKPPRRQR